MTFARSHPGDVGQTTIAISVKVVWLFLCELQSDLNNRLASLKVAGPRAYACDTKIMQKRVVCFVAGGDASESMP